MVGDEWRWMNRDRLVNSSCRHINVIWQKLIEPSETSLIFKDLAEAGQPGHQFKQPPHHPPTCNGNGERYAGLMHRDNC
jgi:hypothetical protein